MTAFETGSLVRVTTTRDYHGYNLAGFIGTVVSDRYVSNIAVEFDNVKNPHSKYGYFYFDHRQLEPVGASNTKKNMGEKTMTKINNHLNVAHVTPCGTKTQTTVVACANFIEDLADGDLCVFNTDGEYRLGYVTGIKEHDGKPCYHEIVTRVVTLEYDNRVLKRKHAAELKSKMEARAKQLQDIALYQMLAKDDPDMAALLREYQSIDKV